jgi:hypothetical protein
MVLSPVETEEASLTHGIKPRGAGENSKGPQWLPRLFDLLVGLGEALMPPWRRWSRPRKAMMGAVAVLTITVCLAWLVVRVLQWLAG